MEKPDYAEQASAELEKILSKATMLIEMLNEVKPGEIIGRGDIFEVPSSSGRQFQDDVYMEKGEDHTQTY